MNVKGIGEKSFLKLKPLVTVGDAKPARSSQCPMAPVTLAAGAASASSLAADQRGFTLVELLLTAAIIATILSMSVPMTTTALDEIRTSMAARYLEGRIVNARMLAVKRSASVAAALRSGGPRLLPLPNISTATATASGRRRLRRASIRSWRRGWSLEELDSPGLLVEPNADRVRVAFSRASSIVASLSVSRSSRFLLRRADPQASLQVLRTAGGVHGWSNADERGSAHSFLRRGRAAGGTRRHSKRHG